MCDLALTTPSLRRALAIACFAAVATLANDASALTLLQPFAASSRAPAAGHSLAHVADLVLEP